MDAAPISTLTLDQLAEVLSHVPIRERLSACSLVSTNWRTAAAAATTAVLMTATFQPERPYHYGVGCTPAVGAWLQQHSARVQVTQLRVMDVYLNHAICIPLDQLRSLKALELTNFRWAAGAAPSLSRPSAQASTSNTNSGSSMQGLEQLSALTELTLKGRSVRLAGLASLAGLRDVTLHGSLPAYLCPDNTACAIDNVDAAQRLLADALPRLQQLTRLELKQAMATTSTVSCVRGLQSLQQLVLDGADGGFEQLPATLTALTLSLVYGHPGSITRSNAAGLLQLTVLQSLQLRGELKVVDLSLLGSMRGLRALCLQGCLAAVQWAAGSPDLQCLTCFTALTSLSIRGSPCRRMFVGVTAGCGITAAEAAAVTSSSQLVSLVLGGKHAWLQPEAYPSLFPPGRLLQHLTMLQLSAELLLHPAAVRQAGACCPNLQELHLTWPGSENYWGCGPDQAWPWGDGQAALVADGLGALSAWAGLQELQLLCQCHRFPAPFWVSLGSLSQLTELNIHCMPEPVVGLHDQEVLCLQGCTALQHLSTLAEGCGIVWELDLASRAPRGSASDVWLQLPEQLKDTSAQSEDVYWL